MNHIPTAIQWIASVNIFTLLSFIVSLMALALGFMPVAPKKIYWQTH